MKLDSLDNSLLARQAPDEQWHGILYSVALGYLSRREYSCVELEQKLSSAYNSRKDKQKDLSPLPGESVEQVIRAVLARLKEHNYLSDLRFAEMVFRTRTSRCYGLFRIKMELREKGVQESVIQEALERSGIDWFELSRSCYERKFRDRDIEDYRDRSRRVRFMQSRGFDQDQISHALG